MSGDSLAMNQRRAQVFGSLGSLIAFLLSNVLAGSFVALSIKFAPERLHAFPDTSWGRWFDVLVRFEWLCVFDVANSFGYYFALLSPAVPVTMRMVGILVERAVLLGVFFAFARSLAWLLVWRYLPSFEAWKNWDDGTAASVAEARMLAPWVCMLIAIITQFFAQATVASIHQAFFYTPTFAANNRGTPVLSLKDAKTFIEPPRKKVQRISWAGLDLPLDFCGSHFALLGPNGSGKTLLLQCLLRSGLLPHRGEPRYRSVFWDEKRDAFPALIGSGIATRFIEVLNPFDERCLAYWDLSADFDTPTLRKQLAGILCPVENGDREVFFPQAGQQILEELFSVLQSWTLNDVCELVRNPANLIAALKSDPNTFAVAQTILGSQPQAMGVLGTLQNKVGPMSAVAAAYSRLPNAFTLKEWYGSGSTTLLLLSNDPTQHRSLQTLFRALLERLAEILLGRVEENPEDLTWLSLDEVGSLGNVTALPRLLQASRSKGCHCALSSQSVEALELVFGERAAQTILGECPNFGVLPPGSVGTRQFLSKLTGTVQANALSSSGAQLADRPALYDGELNALGSPSLRHGIPVLARARGTGFWRGNVAPEWLAHHLPTPSKKPHHAGFLPRPAYWAEPRRLNEEDFERLGFAPAPPGATIESMLQE